MVSQTSSPAEPRWPRYAWSYDPRTKEVLDYEGTSVATLATAPFPRWAVREHGYLLAQAPDLLAACEDLYERVCDCRCGGYDKAVVKAAEAAIIRART